MIGELPTISPQSTVDDEDESILEDGNFIHFSLIFVIFVIKSGVILLAGSVTLESRALSPAESNDATTKF